MTVSGGGVEGCRRRFTFYGLGGTKVRYKSGSSGSISGHQLLLVNATEPPPAGERREISDKAVIRLEPGALNLGNWV